MNDTPPIHRPAIAQPKKPLSIAVMAGTLTLAGAGIFLWLAESRAAQAAQDSDLPGITGTAITTPVPLLPPAKEATLGPVATPVATIAAPASTPIIAPFPGAVDAAAERARARLRAPALIVDLAQAAPPPRIPGGGAVASDAPGSGAPAAGSEPSRTLSDNERFSARVGGEDIEVAEAQRLTGLDRMVPQGAIIGAVMETALNSDLPGYARAIVQRDVLSFDGSAVLIPAGSRVIGQYKSGVAQGASRIFIIWTRLIRPDGVSVALASPAIDDLGRGGVAGKVNRHFLQRFGGAILLSVITGGVNAAAASVGGNSGSTVIVGSAGQASSLATQAAGDLDIPPTITTKQGSSVRIFVARDLDFTRAGPVE